MCGSEDPKQLNSGSVHGSKPGLMEPLTQSPQFCSTRKAPLSVVSFSRMLAAKENPVLETLM